MLPRWLLRQLSIYKVKHKAARASIASNLRKSLRYFKKKFYIGAQLFEKLQAHSKHEIGVDFEVYWSKQKYLAHFTIHIG